MNSPIRTHRQTGEAIASNYMPVTAETLSADLPPCYRVESLQRTPSADRKSTISIARLYHDRGRIDVTWKQVTPDTRIKTWSLVKVRWAGHRQRVDGRVGIDRLVLVEVPDASVNQFTMIPQSIHPNNRDVIQRAAQLFAELPRCLAQLFNLLLSTPEEFMHFVTGPSSMKDHHSYPGGNLEHSVEVAEFARAMGAMVGGVDVHMLTFGGLVHDIGKLAEYQYLSEAECYGMTDRGQAVGHRDTAIKLLGAALSKMRPRLSEKKSLALEHMLFACNAPDYTGLRKPRSLEADIRSFADLLSGSRELHRRFACVDPAGGFGKYIASRRTTLLSHPVGSWGEAANDAVFLTADQIKNNRGSSAASELG